MPKSDPKMQIPDGLFVSMNSPLLGTRTRRLTEGRMVIRQRDETVYDEDLPQSIGLDPGMVETDWSSDPWFAHELPEGIERTLASAGFTCDKRQVAADGLRIAFPHEVCREMALDEGRLEIIAGLYEPSVIDVMPLLPLGFDLYYCRPEPNHKLLESLRRPVTFSAATHEVWTWARLMRAGLAPELEPRGRGEKRPDFAASGGGEVCFIEAKTNPCPDAERALRELQQWIGPHVDGLALPDKFLHVKGTEFLGEAFLKPDPRVQVKALRSELRAGLTRIRKAMHAAGNAAGEYSGGKHVSASLATEPNELVGQTAVDLWAGFPEKKLVARVIRKICEANGQVPRGQKVVVAIEVGGLKNLELLQTDLQFAAKARPRDFECIASVVVVATTHTETRFRFELTLVFFPSTPRLTPLQWHVVEALLGRPVNEPPDWPIVGSGEQSEPSPFGRGTILTCPLRPDRG